MYVQRVYHRPIPGKGPELRAALEERVRIEIEKGTRINLFSQVVLPHGPQFLVITAHESAEALEKWRDANSSDQAELEFRAQTASLRSGAVKTRLLKMLIPAQRSASERYLHVSHINPLPDKEGEVQSLLLDAIKEYQSERTGIRLLREVFNPEGRVLVIADTYENLTEYDNLLDHRPATITDAIAKSNSLSRAPIGHELYEVIIRSSN